jgi:hypothetical protein
VLGPNDSPQWNLDLFEQGNSFLTLLPVDWSADWHENHVPKWIFVLRGAWSVQSMDGQRQVFGPGDFPLPRPGMRSADRPSLAALLERIPRRPLPGWLRIAMMRG